MIDDFIATGASQFLSDAPADLRKWCDKALAASVPIRANVDALLVNQGPVSEIRRDTRRILQEYHDHPGFLLGCGIVAYDGKPEHVIAIREVISEFE